MNEQQLPAPEFDVTQYQRPNQKWECGYASEGRPCRIGPGGGGRCRATFECTPLLEVREGETKGRWTCKRLGEPCAQGPLPDGTCCNRIPKCSPVRSLRGQRGVVTWLVVAATVALLLILLGGPARTGFLNSGDLSTPHSGEAFAALHGGTNMADHACAACHAAGLAGPAALVRAAFTASPGPLEFKRLASTKRTDMTAIDNACQSCHPDHLFHQPNVVRDHSCSLCHQEHQGSGPLRPPTDANCASCHGDATVMALSAAHGATLPAEAFDYRPELGRIRFHSPRPSEGYTKRVNRFSVDHPEFQVHADKLRDPNTLKFGHALHLTGETIPKLPDGQSLDCAYCHKPDAAGSYLQPIRFESHCRVCHSLQFDAETPELTLPHGNPAFVSAFLRSLPKQYADQAARDPKLAGEEERARFVQAKLDRLRLEFTSGEELERRVFFSTATIGPAARVSTLSAEGRAVFPGCVYCHEVMETAGGSPVVTPPVIPDRWLSRGEFNHGRHAMVACAGCHDAHGSHETSDIILPTRQSCVECHGPKGGVKESCSTCHAYHTSRR